MEYLVSIGSNEGRRQNMLLARRRLSELFADIRFSCEEETAPLYLHRSCRFSNQVACFHSDLCADEVRERLYSTAKDIGEPGFDTDSGWGIVSTQSGVTEDTPYTESARGADPEPLQVAALHKTESI